MASILERDFWVDSSVRAVKTTAQTALGVGLTATTSLLDVDWLGVLSASGLAGLVSMVMSVAQSDAPGDVSLHDLDDEEA